MTKPLAKSTEPRLSPLHDTLKRLQLRAEQALAMRLPAAEPPAARLLQAMSYATLNGGKRIRACLIYVTGEALGADSTTLDDAACAVEMIHSYSLIHDDLPCMDNDDLRRGKPTCHRAFDEATALLAGDALQGLAFEILAERDDPRRLVMTRLLARAIGAQGMAGGQAIDLGAVGRVLTPTELEDMHRRKTGALIHAAVMLGAWAATPVEPAVLAALDRYGWAVGLAFQIVDDVLDEEEETATLGKTAGADRARGKPTYPSVLGLPAAKARAQELLTLALESLKPLGDNARLLSDLARYIVERRQ
ncbi:MAG: polyprenyl synthetase family protein [Gammaproteobacteria bacterium]|nr:polyprenyl synthetase family protein [Gammaproteobacteria bacterium]